MATLSVTVEIPELLKGLQNQCELFIHGSNPQLYCHLICGYGRALMALMLSNRCPCSATQVRLHLVTPLSPGTRWPAAHFILSSGGQLLYENMYYHITVHLKKNQAKCLNQNIHDLKIFFGVFDHGVNINNNVLIWMADVYVCATSPPPPSDRQQYTLLAVPLNSAEIAWIEIL